MDRNRDFWNSVGCDQNWYSNGLKLDQNRDFLNSLRLGRNRQFLNGFKSDDLRSLL